MPKPPGDSSRPGSRVGRGLVRRLAGHMSDLGVSPYGCLAFSELCGLFCASVSSFGKQR